MSDRGMLQIENLWPQSLQFIFILPSNLFANGGKVEKTWQLFLFFFCFFVKILFIVFFIIFFSVVELFLLFSFFSVFKMLKKYINSFQTTDFAIFKTIIFQRFQKKIFLIKNPNDFFSNYLPFNYSRKTIKILKQNFIISKVFF